MMVSHVASSVGHRRLDVRPAGAACHLPHALREPLQRTLRTLGRSRYLCVIADFGSAQHLWRAIGCMASAGQAREEAGRDAQTTQPPPERPQGMGGL
jgi:hypothetical protein